MGRDQIQSDSLAGFCVNKKKHFTRAKYVDWLYANGTTFCKWRIHSRDHDDAPFLAKQLSSNPYSNDVI